VAEGRSDARFGLVGLGVGAAGLFAFALGRLTAAVVVDPRRAGGLDAALRASGDTGPGTALLIVVALGFAVYGVYCAVDAVVDAATRRA
jgi:hypothetical protein